MPESLARLLDRLEELQRPAAPARRAQLQRVLGQLASRRFTSAAALIRFHESLLFLCAYPQSAALRRRAEQLLATFEPRVAELRRAAVADFDTFSYSDVSGIAGTDFTAVFGYDITRWLAGAYPRQVTLVWERFDQLARLSATFPRFLPLFAESAYVDAAVPFRAWLRAALPPGATELSWLLRQFAWLPVSEPEQAELFEPLQLWVRWQLGNGPATRTHLRRPRRKFFYHHRPLLQRRDVTLAHELAAPPLPVKKLTPAAGAKLLAMGRSTMAVRFRELHGFTHGDPATVWRAEAGRGVELFLWGVPPARRLPTLAYHALALFKNGVPCGYAEALSLCERTELGLNIFYTFRAGESAWLYARLMRLCRQLLGVNVFSIDPYQLGGAHNEEGIESGAYWFYRKLGFQPTDPALAKLDATELRRLACRPDYRTPAATLRRLAAGHVLYYGPGAEPGVWDQFHIHNLTLAVARRMGREFDGAADRLRPAASAAVSHALGVNFDRWSAAARRACADLVLVLALVPELARWSNTERRAVVAIMRAKAGREELHYLRLLQGHARLRRAIITLGTTKQMDGYAERPAD